jgi:peptide/nickel transport system ATP-binding protein
MVINHHENVQCSKIPLLSVQNLSVSFRTEDEIVTPVRDVSLDLNIGETLALVGESGSGKSVTSLAIMGLLPRISGFISAGQINFKTKDNRDLDLARMSFDKLRHLRGREIAMIFQEPMTSLNPVLTIGEQIAEAVRLHLGLSGRALWSHVKSCLDRVEIPDAGRRMDEYPHHMSGGMRQRVMIALAMACHPKLLIADEPTTALDVTIQAQILSLIDKLRRETGMAVLFITHNLGVVAEIADRVSVMYAGQVVETAKTKTLFHHPHHPYTKALFSCLPSRANLDRDGLRRLNPIPGQPGQFGQFCAFEPRCLHAQPLCINQAPHIETNEDRSVRCLRWRELS